MGQICWVFNNSVRIFLHRLVFIIPNTHVKTRNNSLQVSGRSRFKWLFIKSRWKSISGLVNFFSSFLIIICQGHWSFFVSKTRHREWSFGKPTGTPDASCSHYLRCNYDWRDQSIFRSVREKLFILILSLLIVHLSIWVESLIKIVFSRRHR